MIHETGIPEAPTTPPVLPSTRGLASWAVGITGVLSAIGAGLTSQPLRQVQGLPVAGSSVPVRLGLLAAVLLAASVAKINWRPQPLLLVLRAVAGGLIAVAAVIATRSVTGAWREPRTVDGLSRGVVATVGTVAFILACGSIGLWFTGRLQVVALMVALAAVLGAVGFGLRTPLAWDRAPDADSIRRIASSSGFVVRGSRLQDGVGGVEQAAIGSGLLGLVQGQGAYLVDETGRIYRFAPTKHDLRRIGFTGHTTVPRADEFSYQRVSSFDGKLLVYNEFSIVEVDGEGKAVRVLATMASDRSGLSIEMLKKQRAALVPGNSIRAVAPGQQGSLLLLADSGLYSIAFPADTAPTIGLLIDRATIESGVNPNEWGSEVAVSGPDHVVISDRCRVMLFPLRMGSQPTFQELVRMKPGVPCQGQLGLAADAQGRAWMLTPDTSKVVPLDQFLSEKPIELGPPGESRPVGALAFHENGSVVSFGSSGASITGSPTKEFSR